jgi:hypothetical protein
MPYPNRFIAFFTEEHHIGNMERCLLLQNPSLSLFPMGPRMPLHKIDLFNQHLLLLGKDF